MSAVVLKTYRAKFREFLSYTGLSAEDCQNEVIDLNLANYFNAKFLEGHRAHLGEQTLAAVAMMWPQLSKNVGDKLPRASRCLRGWRKACPTMSKMPWGWAVWCAIASELSQCSPVLGFMVLLGVELYLRVTELLSVTAGDLLPPSSLA